MPAYLRSLGIHRDLPIDGSLLVVGRHLLCDLRVDSHRVSRRHCCLTLEPGGLLVRDLGSTNGTWINGRRVDLGRLRPGDELALGRLRYRFEIGGPEADGPGPDRPPVSPILDTLRDDVSDPDIPTERSSGLEPLDGEGEPPSH